MTFDGQIIEVVLGRSPELAPLRANQLPVGVFSARHQRQVRADWIVRLEGPRNVKARSASRSGAGGAGSSVRLRARDAAEADVSDRVAHGEHMVLEAPGRLAPQPPSA